MSGRLYSYRGLCCTCRDCYFGGNYFWYYSRYLVSSNEVDCLSGNFAYFKVFISFSCKAWDYPITQDIENNAVTLSKALLGCKVFQGNPVQIVDLKRHHQMEYFLLSSFLSFFMQEIFFIQIKKFQVMYYLLTLGEMLMFMPTKNQRNGIIFHLYFTRKVLT